MSGSLLHLLRILVASYFALDKAAVLCASRQATATASAGAAVAAAGYLHVCQACGERIPGAQAVSGQLELSRVRA